MDYLDVYLIECGGKYWISEEPKYTECHIEVPEPTIPSPPINLNYTFRGALNRFINIFTSTCNRVEDGIPIEADHWPENMKLLVSGRESFDTLEEWVRGSVLLTKQEVASMTSSAVDSPFTAALAN